MRWSDEGYLLSKSNFDENSVIIEAFTFKHGKYSGIVYGGSSRKQKKNIQIGNKILLNWVSKGSNKPGYFNVELLNPIAPFFFEDKKRSACIRASTSILKILLPERHINQKIYISFEKMLNDLKSENWIQPYILWEMSLIKELGFEINFTNDRNLIKLNDKTFKVPNIFINKDTELKYNNEIKIALNFNKNLLLENFIIPNRLQFPFFRNILENYFI